MRERIERYVQQRTEMLAGVSHDLKTPLTRLRLQLAMMGDSVETRAAAGRRGEMEHMLDEYLEFARGEGGEEPRTPISANRERGGGAAARGARGADRIGSRSMRPAASRARRQAQCAQGAAPPI
jgi:two-component system osmolarity sensor histidine kinase EnvZ